MVNLNRQVERRTKKLIFEKAKEASEKLVLWNHPNKKGKLSPLDRKEAEYLLWYDNKLDRLIYKVLGDDGWNNFKASKFSNDNISELVAETQKLNLFLNSLGR